MRFQKMDKSLIEIANEKHHDYFIKNFMGQVRCILLSVKTSKL